MKLYLATWLFEESQGRALTKCGAFHRLLSYYHTRERVAEFKEYVLTGLNQNKRRGKKKRN